MRGLLQRTLVSTLQEAEQILYSINIFSRLLLIPLLVIMDCVWSLESGAKQLSTSQNTCLSPGAGISILLVCVTQRASCL